MRYVTLEEVDKFFDDKKLYSLSKFISDGSGSIPTDENESQSVLLDYLSECVDFDAAMKKMPTATVVSTEVNAGMVWDYLCKHSGTNWGIGMERLRFKQDAETETDVTILYRTKNVGFGGLGVVVLIVSTGVFNYLYYSLYPLGDTLSPLGSKNGMELILSDREYQYNTDIALLQRIVYGRLGIGYSSELYHECRKGEEAWVFPGVGLMEGASGVSKSVKSRICTMVDVNVPAYISYNCHRPFAAVASVKESKEEARVGCLTTLYPHTQIGFPDMDNFDKRFIPKDFAECDDTIRFGEVPDITFLELVPEDVVGRVSETQLVGMMGTAVGILRRWNATEVTDGPTRLYSYSGERKVHAAHKVSKWEPDDTTRFMAGDIAEVRVSELYADIDPGSKEIPDRYYMHSESGRWYLYDYSYTDEILKTQKAGSNFEICGIGEMIPVVNTLVGYSFGMLSSGDTFVEHRAVAALKAQAKSKDVKGIFDGHTGSYLKPLSDMRVVWKELLDMQGWY